MTIESADDAAIALWPLPTTSRPKMKMPMTIVGTPARTFSAIRIDLGHRGGANSVLKIAIRTPIGTAISVAMPVMIRVPTIAFSIPPPVWNDRGTGVFVKKSTLSAGRPLRGDRHDDDPEDDDREHGGRGRRAPPSGVRRACAGATAASRP